MKNTKPNIQDYPKAIFIISVNTSENIKETETHYYAINTIIHTCNYQGYIIDSTDLIFALAQVKNWKKEQYDDFPKLPDYENSYESKVNTMDDLLKSDEFIEEHF